MTQKKGARGGGNYHIFGRHSHQGPGYEAFEGAQICLLLSACLLGLRPPASFQDVFHPPLNPHLLHRLLMPECSVRLDERGGAELYGSSDHVTLQNLSSPAAGFVDGLIFALRLVMLGRGRKDLEGVAAEASS